MVDSYQEPIAPPTQILADLYLGDAQDARHFKGIVISVHEDLGTVPEHGIHLPILKPYDWRDPTAIAEADPKALERAAAAIHAHRGAGRRVLVHCYAGIERSPLTVAYYLHRYGHAKTISEAYDIVRSKRPIVQDRQSWLPTELVFGTPRA
jgi:protein-tyrosine phosphatase